MKQQKTAKQRRTQRFAYLLIILGVGLAIAAFFIWRSGPEAPLQAPNINQAAPSAKKPSQHEVTTYSVAPDLPRTISIPAISVPQSRVISLGLTKGNQIAAPNNVYDAGWYTGSAKPGQQGAMFIYGHVSSWQAKGIFYNLGKLKAGDSVTITRGDGKIYTYQVVSLKTYPYNDVDMQTVLSPVDANTPGLNLMTCTGKVIKGTSTFDHRLVVFTKLVQ